MEAFKSGMVRSRCGVVAEARHESYVRDGLQRLLAVSGRTIRGRRDLSIDGNSDRKSLSFTSEVDGILRYPRGNAISKWPTRSSKVWRCC